MARSKHAEQDAEKVDSDHEKERESKGNPMRLTARGKTTTPKQLED